MFIVTLFVIVLSSKQHSILQQLVRKIQYIHTNKHYSKKEQTPDAEKDLDGSHVTMLHKKVKRLLLWTELFKIHALKSQLSTSEFCCIWK